MTKDELVRIEREFEAEARAYGLKKFETRLQELADKTPATGRDGKPLTKVRLVDMQIQSVMGKAHIMVKCGKSKTTGKYETPFRLKFFRAEKAAISPELEQRVVATSCETSSFEKASELCKKWGCEISDDKIMNTIKRVAKACHDRQLPGRRDCAAGKNDTLIVMMDGWFARHREDKWGQKRAPIEERVAWREIKSAIIYKLSQVTTVSRERGMIITKHIVAMPAGTDPVEFGEKVKKEAIRMGMLEAQKTYLIIDGGLYLWGIYEDRFSNTATAQLDYYHASEHLQALAEAIFEKEQSEEKEKWLRRLRRNLKIWGPNTLMEELAKARELQVDDSERSEIIRQESAYFRKHESHMNYRKARKEGVPIGSGSVESLCSQLQTRFKRTGQFWSHKGLDAFLKVYTLYRNEELEYCYNKSA